MLSIKVCLWLVNLVGEVVLGRRSVEYIYDVKKVKHFYLSHILERSVLKSPSNITSLFLLINFSERDFGYWSLHSLYSSLNSPQPRQHEKVVTDVNNKLGELNIDIIINRQWKFR